MDHNKTQFLSEPNPSYIDKTAKKYVLSSPTIYQEKNKRLLIEKYKPIAIHHTENEYLNLWNYISELSDRVVDYYCPRIGAHYNVEWEKDQFHFYWGPFVESLLFDAYDCFQRISCADDNNMFIRTRPNSFSLPLDSGSSVDRTLNVEFRTFFYSRFFSYLNYNVEQYSLYKVDQMKANAKAAAIKWGARLKKAWRNPKEAIAKLNQIISRSKLKQNEKGENSISTEEMQDDLILPDCDVFVVKSRMRPSTEKIIGQKSNGLIAFSDGKDFRQYTQIISKNNRPDYDSRKEVFSGFPATNEFEKMIDFIFRDFTPKSYFEAFPALWMKAEEMANSHKYRKIYHSAFGTEFFRLFCTISKKHGCLICDIQHSAVYGNNYCFGFPEYKYHDRFLTWGWQPEQVPAGTIRAVAMSRLPLISNGLSRKITKTEKDRILLVTSAIELCECGRGWDYQNYTERQMRFIDSLSEANRKKMVIRTVHPKEAMDLYDKCKKKYPYIQFEHYWEKPFSVSLAESDLRVCDYYGSSHLEALFLNRPFLMFNGVQIAVPNHGIQKYLDEFERLGIYVNDGEVLAEHINSHTDWDAWLNNPKCKSLFDSYLHEMAGATTEQEATNLWYQEFMSEGEE